MLWNKTLNCKIGIGGGITMLWNKTLNCKITNYSQNHVDVKITERNVETNKFLWFSRGRKKKGVMEFFFEAVSDYVTLTLVRYRRFQRHSKCT